MNVKSLFTGQQSINCKRCPLYKDSCAASLAYLGSMVSWIKGWHSLNPQHELSKETRLAMQHTTSTIVELVKYLFKVETDIEYILLGQIQSDYIDGPFGFYRQLNGGNYYASVLQFLQKSV